MELLILVISAMLVKNILLAQYLGNCPFCGVSNRMDTALGMGMAVIFVLTLSSACTWVVQRYMLDPFGLGYLQTLVFILVIAALVQLVEMFLKKSAPLLYQALGIYLPLITTNCAVLGVAIICIRRDYDFVHTIVFSLASAAGFSLALVLMAGIRRRISVSPVPRALQGTAITLITAGLMALAFFGFAGVDASLTALK
ncbi:MAG: electron transport complex subunit RsxA [Candidatus Raymondbacteria bacterium RifOxyA12_full_50_37]|uniref:Ion-translocating oxidoreductase complex subunit A n=1 Tax=Candidatus Raymondbacteria bacterium RIFOXYD12_FULL_49_13 TaxID=1817890 RepID=A0A1F7FFS0_UNCRA|nr:MAG: electron transport complex subunit RsxA [Candidatus Raymondbacteria bacterium RifOxyA12_full_50_37]OGJ86415.1 MAG: electron transport complex subunit RsxA [Candidatus Raymondbacteria bacterium RIFOXYA2_FULL_49_16]OGJ87927.1 MAG: electron transport complex subunit RsxA [Candidatus Raymondbacteria bacterium RifOxyB12_full_50_8]OGJ95585.1 MAG: electron transport complex subunit RsxA [Candidatus Raymondbacteria bacterium RIFOXYC2_FULL_50_21]OGK05544.1 MAG: electron transport complex subunit